MMVLTNEQKQIVEQMKRVKEQDPVQFYKLSKQLLALARESDQ